MAISGKKVLIGCALGCGGLIVLVIAVLVSFGIWINRPGDLLEPEKLLGGDTTGHVEWTLRLEDPGTEGFVRAVIGAVQSLQNQSAQELPPWLSGWFGRRQAARTERDILQLFPVVAAWTLRPSDTPDEDLHLFSLSIERLGNRMVFGDWLLGWIVGRDDRTEVERYRGERIYSLPLDRGKRVTFFIRGADIFFTSDAETAHVAVDRLIGSFTPERESIPLDPLFGETEGGGPLRGAITNGRGELLRLWRWISSRTAAGDEDRLWRELRGVTLAGSLNGDGSLAVKLRFVCPDARWAATYAPGIDSALREGLEWTELDLEFETRPAGDRIEVDVRLEDLIGFVGGKIDIDDRAFQRPAPD
jgi:hypothetical protein